MYTNPFYSMKTHWCPYDIPKPDFTKEELQSLIDSKDKQAQDMEDKAAKIRSDIDRYKKLMQTL